MSKKKTTSNDEKLDICVDFFMEHTEPYSIKELEKALPKFHQAIKFPLVKDLLTQLTADNRIDTDKIGLGNYYWLFPSAASETRKRKKQELEKQIEDEKLKKVKLEEEIEEAKIGKEETEERVKNLERLEELKKEKEEILQQLKRYEDLDPELYEKIKSDAKVCLDSANRWTDNIFTILQFCKTKFGQDESQLKKSFGIPEEFDYVG
ncbi:hypothetical protein ABK040_011263 [Willaertia magna]